VGERRLAMTDPEDAELRAQLRTAEEVLACAVAEARIRPEVAAAACAVLAGEYAAVVAAKRQLSPGPVLDEAARVLRRRGEAVHRALRSGEEASAAEEGDAGGRAGNPRRRLWRQVVDVGDAPSESAALPGGKPTYHVDSLVPLIATQTLRQPPRPPNPARAAGVARLRVTTLATAASRVAVMLIMGGGLLWAGFRGRASRRSPDKAL
jgi:hypothetical protein